VRIINSFENFEFDVLIFDVDDDTGKSEDLACYLSAVVNKQWTKDCKLGQGNLATKVLSK